MNNFNFKALCSTLILGTSLTTTPIFADAMPPVNAKGRPTATIAPMLKTVMPAIVHITAKGQVEIPYNPFLEDPSEQQNTQGRFESYGSGVIINANNGYIVTNSHVVQDSQTITVTLSDGRHIEADLIGSDEASDIALLQITAEKLTSVMIADSNEVEVGDFVAAIGNPYGLNQSVTSGIVSAIERSGLGIEGYENFIQTDAPINPGNSGGALVNLSGELIGINTAILGPDGGNVGIGFSIPSAMMVDVVTQLIKYGKVDRGVMGVLVQDFTPALAEAFGYPDIEGAIISQVLPGSPAKKAGFEVGDIIQQIDGKKITTSAEVRNIIGFIRAGTEVNFAVYRDGKVLNLSTTTATRKSFQSTQEKSNPYFDDVTLSNVDLQNTVHGHVTGIRVQSVTVNSQAWAGGLRPGDIIVSADKQAVHSIAELNSLLVDTDKSLVLNVLRGNNAIFVVMK